MSTIHLSLYPELAHVQPERVVELYKRQGFVEVERLADRVKLARPPLTGTVTVPTSRELGDWTRRMWVHAQGIALGSGRSLADVLAEVTSAVTDWQDATVGDFIRTRPSVASNRIVLEVAGGRVGLDAPEAQQLVEVLQAFLRSQP